MLTTVGGFAAAAAAQTPSSAAKAGAAVHVRRACAAPTSADAMSCFVLVRTDIKAVTAASMRPGALPNGYGPAQLQSAYNLPSSTAGAGESVAVVDAFDDPTAVADLAVYRKTFGLPACNTKTEAGCLTKVNQNGAASPLPAPSGSTGWATEESLDVDMVSAICPKCHIYLVEAIGPSTGNLGTGVDSAVSVLHVKFISNSYGGMQRKTDPALDTKYYKHAGVAVVASAGDSGYGVSYPAASQYVTAVGGTDLTKAPERPVAGKRSYGPAPAPAARSTRQSPRGRPTRAAAGGPTTTCQRRGSRDGGRHVRHLRPGWLDRRRRHECVLADHRLGVRSGRQPGQAHVPVVVPVRTHERPERRDDR